MKQMTMFAPIGIMLAGPFAAGSFVLALAANSSGVSGPTFTTIDVPGATATSASKINDRGQIVGGYSDAGGTSHGFLLDNGVLTTIDVPGAADTGAFGDASGILHGFLAVTHP